MRNLRILLTAVHHGWEYEFAKGPFDIVRVEPTARPTQTRPSTERPLRENLSTVGLDSLDAVVRWCDVIVVTGKSWLPLLLDRGRPTYFVPHTDRNLMLGCVQDYVHVVHTCRWSAIHSDVREASIIYNGVSIKDFVPWSYGASQQSIVSSCPYMPSRPGVAGLDIWQHVTAGQVAFALGEGNAILNPGGRDIVPPDVQSYAEALVFHRVFLNTTLASLMPMSIYEAMACGMPIVSTGTYGIPEVLLDGESALLGENADELRAHIARIMRDRSLANRLGRRARELARCYYNSERMVAEWASLLSDSFGA